MGKISKKEDVKLFDITKLRWAVEIEVEFPKSKDSEKLISRHSMIRGWTMDMDGSLDNGVEYRPKNSNKLYFNEESMTQLKEVLALIKCHKGKISSKCGLHIHIDCSKFTDRQVLEIIREFIHKQRYIITRFNVHKDRLDEYCKLLPTNGLTKIKLDHISKHRRTETDWSYNEYGYLQEKYYSLNVNHLSKGDYGTIEIRLFNGSIKYKELKDRILWTLNFIKDCIERD